MNSRNELASLGSCKDHENLEQLCRESCKREANTEESRDYGCYSLDHIRAKQGEFVTFSGFNLYLLT